MLFYLFLLFTLVPLVELSLLVWIGGKTVWWLPIALVLFTGIVGASLARRQGWQVGRRIQNDVRSGRLPAGALLDGFLILVAAVLLITPGVLTDVVGLALLTRPVRNGVKRAALSQLRRYVQQNTTQFRSATERRGADSQGTSTGHDQIIDAKVISTHVEDA